MNADTAFIDTPHLFEPTMNTNAHTAPRFAALFFAGVMTLATLMGVGQLADQSQTNVQMSQVDVRPVEA